MTRSFVVMEELPATRKSNSEGEFQKPRTFRKLQIWIHRTGEKIAAVEKKALLAVLEKLFLVKTSAQTTPWKGISGKGVLKAAAPCLGQGSYIRNAGVSCKGRS